MTRRRTETPLDYKLHLRDGRWKVYDILIDHVSFVSMYRSSRPRVLQREPYTRRSSIACVRRAVCRAS